MLLSTAFSHHVPADWTGTSTHRCPTAFSHSFVGSVGTERSTFGSYSDEARTDNPRPSKTYLAFVVLQGAWEGIVVPTEWSTAAIEALLHALTEVGWEDLADSLELKLSPHT